MKFISIGIIAFMVTITALNFTEKTENTGIIFIKMERARVSYDTFTVVYHLDISEYMKMTTRVTECIDKLEYLCRWTKSTNCELIIENLRNQVTHMKIDESDINSYKISRAKRGLINLGGKILNWIFGVMDADSAQEYDKKINEIHETSKREHTIQNEQLMLVRETLNFSNKSYTELNEKINGTIEKIKELYGHSTKQLEKLQTEEKFLELTNVAQLIIMEHTRLSTQILKNLESTLAGKISQLIPTESLKKDISKISTLLTENQKLPIDPRDEDTLHIFKFATTRAALFNRRLLVELTFPVIERTRYTLYRTIPVPVKLRERTIVITTPPTYFVLSDDRREFIFIDETELKESKTTKSGERIINPAQNAHFSSDDSCEMSIFLNPSKTAIEKTCDVRTIPTNTYFVTIQQNVLYYIYTSNATRIHQHCGRPTMTHTIQNNGYLKLERKCRINTDKISIRPHVDTKMDTTEVISLTNATHNTTLETFSDVIQKNNIPEIESKHRGNVLIQNHNDEYRKLIDKTDELLRERAYMNRFEQAKFDNVKMGICTTSAAIIFTVLSITILTIILYKRFFSLRTWHNLAEKFEENTEKIPKIFIHNIYPKTPRSIRKIAPKMGETSF